MIDTVAFSVSAQLTDNGITVVTVEGELDLWSVPQARAVLRTVLDGADRPYIVIDLAKLVFADSSGLGLIVSAFKRAKGRGGMVALAAVPHNMAVLLTTTGLQHLLPPHATIAEAQAALRAAGASGPAAAATARSALP
jgi:anti-sigma B factor antagonist